MHPCRPRTQTLYFLQSDDSQWVVDGLGDYPLVSGQFYPVATQGPDTLQFVCDAPASLAFTPPSDPGLYYSAGYLPLARLVAAYNFTNA